MRQEGPPHPRWKAPHVGEVLRQARSHRNVSLEEVAQATRIPIKYLLALEEGDMSRLPSPSYARGFVRTYASYLGLDPGEVLALLPRDEEEPRLRPMTRVRPAPGISRQAMGLLAVTGSLVLALVLTLTVAWEGKGLARWAMRPGGVVPPLEGRELVAAISSLEEGGFRFLVVDMSPEGQGEARVVGQAPPAWTMAKKELPVVLVVSR
jgi:transcriptional regulator with XRE-family HTH domain